MRLNMEPDHVGSQQPFHQFALPRADSKCLRIRPWNVPENRYPSVWPFLLDHSGEQRELVILHQNQRLLAVFHLFQQSISEFAIDRLILLPVSSAKNGAGMRDMAERPKSFIREAVIVAFFLFLREPDAAQSVSRIVRRHGQPVMPV